MQKLSYTKTLNIMHKCPELIAQYNSRVSIINKIKAITDMLCYHEM